MRTSIVSALLIALLTLPALAQTGGYIGVYSDNPGFSDCSLTETLFVINYVYVVHRWTVAGARAARFALSINWPEAIPVGVDFMDNTYLGDIYYDVTVIYPTCVTGPHLIASVQIVPLQPAPQCTRDIQVVPGAGVASAFIEVTDCASSCWFAGGERLTVNPSGECPCSVAETSFAVAGDCAPVAAEPTTWGSVKALYR